MSYKLEKRVTNFFDTPSVDAKGMGRSRYEVLFFLVFDFVSFLHPLVSFWSLRGAGQKYSAIKASEQFLSHQIFHRSQILSQEKPTSTLQP